MDIIDTHAHLDHTTFSGQITDVLRRAAEANVRRILCVGTSLTASQRCLQLAREHPDVIVASAGVHPTHCAYCKKGWFDRLKDIAENPGIVAIGETGLDYHHKYTDPITQQSFFRQHIRLADRLAKPLIVHARKADPETLAILREESATTRGVRHCFDSSRQIAQQYVDTGLHIAFGGVLTRPGHKKVKNAARWVPNRRLLLETDCPYMKPHGVEKPQNEPALITHTLRALAGLREQTTEEIARLTSHNARQLFFTNRNEDYHART